MLRHLELDSQPTRGALQCCGLCCAVEKVVRLITDYTELERHRTEEDETIRSALLSLILSRIEEADATAQGAGPTISSKSSEARFTDCESLFCRNSRVDTRGARRCRVQSLRFEDGSAYRVNPSLDLPRSRSWLPATYRRGPDIHVPCRLGEHLSGVSFTEATSFITSPPRQGGSTQYSQCAGRDDYARCPKSGIHRCRCMFPCHGRMFSQRMHRALEERFNM